ncbi:MAG: DUF3187 family protein [Acidobacteriota bacterium]
MLLLLLPPIANAMDGPAERAAGVFALRPQLPGKVPFLWPTFTGGEVPPPGHSRWEANVFHTNTLQYTRGIIVALPPDPSEQDVLTYMDAVHASTGKNLYYFDAETTRLDLSWAIGLPGGWELGAQVPVVSHSGGWLDTGISRFHDATGISDAGRDQAPVNAGLLVLITQQGDLVLTEETLPATEVGDVGLSARVPIPVRGERWSLVAAALLELPTGNERNLVGSGDLDLGASVTADWRRGRARVTLGCGYAALGGLAAIPGLPIRDTWTATAAYEQGLGRRAAFLGQLLYSTSPYRALGQDGLSDPSGIVALGMRFTGGRHWLVDLALAEDALGHNADIDVGLLLGLAWRPGGTATPGSRQVRRREEPDPERPGPEFPAAAGRRRVGDYARERSPFRSISIP